MGTMKNNEKIIKATQEVIKKKETEKLLESKPHFDDDFDELYWEFAHPTPELKAIIKKVEDYAKTMDLTGIPVFKGKLDD